MQAIQCNACHEWVAPEDTVRCRAREAGYIDLCQSCFLRHNAWAERPRFGRMRLAPVVLEDAQGMPHEFHFKLRVHGELASLSAFELKEGTPSGYHFSVVGDDREQPFGLMAELLERMRRGLSEPSLHEEGRALSDLLLQGRIAFDEHTEDDLPRVMIDGRELSWESFGRLLRSYEGWRFKLHLKDPGNEG